MTELYCGVRVQEAFMAAVLIGPTTKTKQTKQTNILQLKTYRSEI
jgi:tartrate dehydratase beta subunit/fumarate hydratase class I family protein